MRKSFGLIVATAALCIGVVGISSSADAMYKKKHHHHNSDVSIGFGLGGYPAYDEGYGFDSYGNGSRYAYDDYNDDEDCQYRRVAIKKWNQSHTHRYVVFRKRLVCY
jgi:hypothetical protein